MILTTGQISLPQLHTITSGLSYGIYQLLCLLLIIFIFVFNLAWYSLGRLAQYSNFFQSLAWIYRSSLFWAVCKTEAAAEKWDTSHQNTKYPAQPHANSWVWGSFSLPFSSFPALPTWVSWSSSRKWNRLFYFYIWDYVKYSGRLYLFIKIRKKIFKSLIQHEEWDYFLHLFFH